MCWRDGQRRLRLDELSPADTLPRGELSGEGALRTEEEEELLSCEELLLTLPLWVLL